MGYMDSETRFLGMSKFGELTNSIFRLI